MQEVKAMSTYRLDGEAKADFIVNYYNKYFKFFNSVCSVTCVQYDIHPEEYWLRFREDIFRYLLSNARTEKLWSDKLIKLAKQSTQSQSFSEPERFIFWFLFQAYQIGTLTNFTDLKQVFREEYRQCQKQ